MKSKSKETFSETNLLTNELPKGWKRKTLLDVSGGEPSLIVGGPFGSSLQVKDYKNEGIPIIRLQNIGKLKFIEKDIKFISIEKAKELEYHTFIKGDLVLAKLGEPIGKTCIIPDKFDRGIVVSDVVRIRLQNENIDKKFLLYYLNSPLCLSQINAQVFGSTRPRVNLKEIRDLSILIPPLAEQHRIVARVEALLSQINTARDWLNRVPLIMKRFRQAVLAAACSGRLTEGWREGQGIIQEISWKSFKLEDIGKWGTGGTPSRKNSSFFDGEIPWIKSGDLNDGVVFNPEEKISEEGLNCSNAKLLPIGTISIALYGATIGKVGILGIKAATNQACANCIVNNDEILNKYLFYYLIQQKQNFIDIGQGGAQPNLTNKIVHQWPIYLPPLSEQHEIVQHVDALFALADQIEHQVAGATKHTEALTQAVLAKAFRGELVATEAELSQKELA